MKEQTKPKLSRQIVITNLILAFLVCFAMLQIGAVANEKDYPTKPIKVIVPYAAGGGGDSTVRVITSIIYPKYLDQPFVIINRPGANGAVGIRELLNSEPDGYTILMSTSSSVVLTPLMLDVGFALDDLTPICSMMDYIGTLSVRSDAPWETLEELIEYSRENPGAISYGTGGTWSMEDLAIKTLNFQSETEWISVPFPNSAEAALACIAGAVEVCTSYGGANPQIKSGLLKPLAVLGDRHAEWLPGVPTLKEVGYDIKSDSSMGFFGPSNLPKNIVEKLVTALKGVYEESDAYQEIVVNKLGQDISWKGTEEYDNQNKGQRAQFIDILKALGEINS